MHLQSYQRYHETTISINISGMLLSVIAHTELADIKNGARLGLKVAQYKVQKGHGKNSIAKIIRPEREALSVTASVDCMY